MRTQIGRLTLAGAFLALVSLPGGYTAGIMKSAAAAEKAATGQAACVSCHPFDKLAAMKPAFKAPGGEIVNPHQYIPHNEKKPENAPDCVDCHTRHPIPPQEKIDLSKVGVENCYLSCHHQQNFEPCDKCHKH